MLFSSTAFLVFFVVVFAVYWRLSHRAQNLFLVAASLYFYGSWNPWLLWLIVFSAVVDYLCARGLDRTESPRARRALLLVSVVTNLALLGYFKYAGFFLESGAALLQRLGFHVSTPTLDIILPVGISFYTFQTMSYTVDVYRRQVQACRGFLDFLLYISFFPQLVAGPIERAKTFLPQVLEPRQRLKSSDWLVATRLLVVGYFQKLVIADSLSPIVDTIFARPAEMDGLTLILGLYAFAFQVYGDFSGYSNIARGVARLLGFRLMENFLEPYLSTNITVLLRRWHVSLSTWLRDYIYFPLGGARCGHVRASVNLMVTMLLGGLWHGASWNYVLWGGLLGVYLVVHKLMLEARRAPPKVTPLRSFLSGFATLMLWCTGLAFFRTATLGDAMSYFRGLVGPWHLSTEAVEILAFGAVTLTLDACMRLRGTRMTHLFFRHWVPETVSIAILVLAVLLVGESDVIPFVYFQF